MKKYIAFIAVMVILVATPIAFAADKAESSADLEIKNELRELRKELSGVKQELKGLKTLIEARLPNKPTRPPAPTKGKATIKGDPILGSDDAALVIVEFSDYQCPFCGRFSRSTFPQIKKEYVDSGKARYVFKDFPLPFHKEAQKAAEAAHCAGEEGKYWEMHDLIFKDQSKVGLEDLKAHARELGLKKSGFNKCLEDGRYAKGVQEDIVVGRTGSGVTGTPSFLIGKLNAKGEVEGTVVRGARPFEAFKTEIDAQLKKK